MRSLKAISVLEASLRGLVESIRETPTASNPFSLRAEVDVDHVRAFLDTVTDSMEDLSLNIATSYTNGVLLQRDLVLASKGCTVEAEAAKELCSKKLFADSLFGSKETELNNAPALREYLTRRR